MQIKCVDGIVYQNQFNAGSPTLYGQGGNFFRPHRKKTNNPGANFSVHTVPAQHRAAGPEATG